MCKVVPATWPQGGSDYSVRMTLNLASSAAVRIFAAEPPLPALAAQDLVDAVQRLLLQFAREGRCTNHHVEAQCGGRFVVIAWEGPPLSGCSHDKIGQVIAHHELRHAVSLINAPPIALGPQNAIQLVDRAGLRALLATQQADGATPVWNVQALTVGAWQLSPQPLATTHLARLLRSSSAALGAPL